MRTKLIILILMNTVALLITVPVLANDELVEPELSMPGIIEGTGTYFEIKDSEYLNIFLQSTEEITISLESAPKTISLNIEASSADLTTLTIDNSSTLTIGALEPNRTYYKFEDSYKNETVFVSDESGSYTYTQDLSQPHHVWIQEEQSATIYLPDQCEIYGLWDSETSTCTLTQDLTESVEITVNDITLDCSDHSITGSGTGYGIYLNRRENITIKNCTVTKFSCGISLRYSSNNDLTENNVLNNKGFLGAMYFYRSSGNNITKNNIHSNDWQGIYLSGSSNNNITENLIYSNNHDGIYVSGEENNIIGNEVSDNAHRGIYLNRGNNYLRNNSMINNKYNFSVDGSEQNIDTSNTVNGKPIYYLVNEQDKVIDSTSNAGFVGVINSKNIIIKGVTVENNYEGVLFFNTTNSIIENVNASNNNIGIGLHSSTDIDIIGNNASGNNRGIYLSHSSSNKTYHNSLIDNSYAQAYVYGGSDNLFDDGYPSGGNYWSDYIGVDEKSGENQDQSGSDGIGDTPYTFTGGEDGYPFMEESGWEAPPIPTYNVAVVLAETNDVNHDSSSISAQPCKLLPEKTYPSGHSKEYYQDLTYCVADYHKENSFGTVDLDFEIFDNDGEWFKLDKTESYYAGHLRELVEDAEIKAGIDPGPAEGEKIIIVVHSGISNQLEEFPFWPRQKKKGIITRTWWQSNEIIVAEKDPIDFWAHEIGHVLGVKLTPENTTTPDLYKMGNMGSIIGGLLKYNRWELMAASSPSRWNDPPYMSSYTKEFLQWLNYDIHPKSAYGEYWINSLETGELEDKVFRYNLTDDVNDESSKYYILEARNRNLETWDSSLPEEEALVLYYVDTKGYPEYGYSYNSNNEIIMPYNQYRKINIPSGWPPFSDGILTPNGDSHLDMAELVYISALSDEQTADIYRIKSKIEKINYDFFSDKFQGIILEPSSQLYDKIIQYLPFDSSLQELSQANNEQLSFQENKSESTFERKKLTKLEKIILFSKHLKNLFTGRSVILDYEYDKESIEGRAIYEWGFDPSEPGRSILKENFFFLLLIALLNLLIVGIDKKIISRWELKKQKLVKGILRAVQLISLIIAIIPLFFLILVLITMTFFSETSADTFKTTLNDNLRTTSALSLEEPITFPDLDLHLYCDDGRHVGMNYETGEYEIQISRAMVSGDNQNAPEWIFIPPDITNCHFVVSSYDNQKFLEENPEIAQEIEDTTDSYNVYARYIDPEADIYTSTIISEDIKPDIELEHQISGTHDIVIGSGILLARVDFNPDTLNLKNKGKWVTAYIELPKDYDPNLIDLNTVLLNGQIPAENNPKYEFVTDPNSYLVDVNNNDILERMVKFDQSAVQDILEIGEEIKITITGELAGGSPFQGSDIIKVISKGKLKDALIAGLLACFAVGGLLIHRRRVRKRNGVLNKK